MIRDALVVGINSYEYLGQLQAPANDAELIAQRLEAQGFWSVKRLPEATTNTGKQRVSSKKTVTIRELKAAIEDLFYPNTRRNKPDAALLYFSGHGLREEGRRRTEGFLAASDVNPEGDRWGVSLDWLRELLKDSKIATQIVWLDCCHSGELLNFEDGNPGAQGLARDRCFIAASQDHKLAYESMDVPYSELTRVLWQGLNTVENRITNLSLTDFISVNFQSQQRPLFHNSGSAIKLLQGTQQLATDEEQHALEPEIPPYRSLAAFDNTEEDIRFFWGRTALVDELLEAICQQSFVAVLGPSGSGKSSVVRAGLLPAIAKGIRQDTQDWQVLPRIIKPVLKPDYTPLQSLAAAFVDPKSPQDEQEDLVEVNLNRLKKGGATALQKLVARKAGEDGNPVVLVIDQFEEVFTLCPDVEEREQFFACLFGALGKENSLLRVILTMRADFLGHCLERDYSGLSRWIDVGKVLVKPMTDGRA